METFIAQGFLRTLLNEAEATQIMAASRKAGRYLIPLEASRILRRDLKKTVTDPEQDRMKETWIKFCRTMDFSQDSSMTNFLVLEPWWAYVARNYHEPLPEPSPWERQ